MNLDDLRSVQSKERQKDSLQHLRDSFYEDVGDYIANLKNERERAAERADDPFSSTEVSQLTDEIETAEEVVEAVYERRMGKIVKRASLAAAGMPADEEGLTSEEAELFADLVERIEQNKDHVLDILAGEASPAAEPTTTTVDDAEPSVRDPQSTASEPHEESTPEQPPGDDTVPPAPPARPPEAASAEAESLETTDVDAADLMGGGDSVTDEGTSEPLTGDPTSSDEPVPDGSPPGDDAGGTPEQPPTEGAPTDGGQPKNDTQSTDDTDRTKVRITEEIGDIFGVDDREYELRPDDVVTLPTVNAEPLVEQDAAERID